MQTYSKKHLIEFKTKLESLSKKGLIHSDKDDFGVDLNNLCIHPCNITLVETITKH